MLDHRVYRVAFIPALVALFVAAFSLTDRPGPRTTRLAPLAFDPVRAFGDGADPPRNSLNELAASFPNRRPGSRGDRRLATRVARGFRDSGFVQDSVRRRGFEADTVDGRRDIETVTAVRTGLSTRSIVVIAHRDALAGPAVAELSGTAVLLELARLFAGRDLNRTIVLSSVSGGTGGFAGAREAAAAAPGPVDGVFVLGDLASEKLTRPFVLPWSDGGARAPLALERTAQNAIRRELRTDPGGARAPAQLLRRALPLTLGEQGVVGAEGLKTVLISASSEGRPEPDAPVSRARFEGFGRAVLRALTATQGARPRTESVFTGGSGVVTMRRLVPDWAFRLLVGTLILPALIVAVDAFFRVRRRGLPMGRWTLWVAALLVPVLVAWGWSRLIDLTTLVPALPAPVAGGAVALDGAGIAAMVTTTVVFGLAAWWAAVQLARGGAMRQVGAGGVAAASSALLAVTTGAVWVVDPYAGLVLLPAAHVWLLVAAPESRLHGRSAWPVALLGLAGPLLILLGYMVAWSLGPVEALWTAWQLMAGGALGIGPMLVLAVLFATGCATAVVLWRRGKTERPIPPARMRTRGPGTYAGPGSLGGTESALRR